MSASTFWTPMDNRGLHKDEAQQLISLIRRYSKDFQNISNAITAYLVNEGYVDDKTFRTFLKVYEEVDDTNDDNRFPFIGMNIIFHNSTLVSIEENKRLTRHIHGNIIKQKLPVMIHSNVKVITNVSHSKTTTPTPTIK